MLSSSLDLEAAAPELRRSLLAWYEAAGRQLPWRQTRDPYAIWISEVMLQQTQVKTVIPYYQRWLTAFPTVKELAQADLQTVLKQWEGLGYYARARNLHQAAQRVVAHHGGDFPRDLKATMALPGIGRTTAGGILSAAFNQALPILDGNVKRILARLLALELPPSRMLDQLWRASQALLDPHRPRDFNQALMDLGATVCDRRRPACSQCPWTSHCQAFHLNRQLDLPMSEPRPPTSHKHIGVGVIWSPQRQILIDRRRPEGLLGGLWEFPGGKLEAGETVADCIKREIREELDIDVAVGEHLITINHAYTHFKLTLNVHHCRHLSGEPKPLESDEVRWVSPQDLGQYPFPTANQRIIEAILSSLKAQS
ncbi:MAG: A/G-specific adenine glycosylase [Elainellaceae cyanobacterium]